MEKSKKTILVLGLVLGLLIVSYALPRAGSKAIEQQRREWMGKADVIRNSTRYVCCLEELCWYCIKKSPRHGLGASCKCGVELMWGEEICGECLGEWIEGHGNPFFLNPFSEVYPQIAEFITEKYQGKTGWPPMMMGGPMRGGRCPMMGGSAYGSRFVERLRSEWIVEANAIRESVKYECGLEEDCLYCIQKSPKHGEGAQCTCKEDLRAGKGICGACLGEWIEGHGETAYWPEFEKAYPKIAEFVIERYQERRE